MTLRNTLPCLFFVCALVLLVFEQFAAAQDVKQPTMGTVTPAKVPIDPIDEELSWRLPKNADTLVLRMGPDRSPRILSGNRELKLPRWHGGMRLFANGKGFAVIEGRKIKFLFHSGKQWGIMEVQPHGHRGEFFSDGQEIKAVIALHL